MTGIISLITYDTPELATISEALHENSLDNVEQHETIIPGIHTDIIRPYNRYSLPQKPRSAGIPVSMTRESLGFHSLNPEVRPVIDSAFVEIRDLWETHNYQVIAFMAEPPTLDNDYSWSRPIIATWDKDVSNAVKNYITDQIYSLGTYS